MKCKRCGTEINEENPEKVCIFCDAFCCSHCAGSICPKCKSQMENA